MGSKGSPNSWTPYDSFKECAQGLCNIYCPQWCSYPPPDPDPDPDPDSDSSTNFSPLVIAVIGILASAFLLVSYYAIITKYCRRRRSRRSSSIEFQEHEHEDQIWQQQQQVGIGIGAGAGAGLDETLINSITVFKFKKGDRLIEGTECSVCLNEFEENENLRLLPKCCHAFHPSCIDVWLKSHTNCPLCRANAVPTYVLPVPPPPNPASSSSSSSSSSSVLVVNTSALQIQPTRSDMMFMMENGRTERSRHSNGEFFIASGGGGGLLDEERQIRRSSSLGTFSSQRSSSNLLIADILRIEEEQEEQDNNDEEICGSNSVRRNPELFRAQATVRRSFSTGRFYFQKTS